MKMKMNEMLNVYTILSTASISKLSDEEKVSFIKLMRKVKPHIINFENAQKDALESAKKDNHNQILENLRKWQAEGNDTTLTKEERTEVNSYIASYNKIVNDSLSDILEEEIEFDPISESLYENLILSNDWNVQQTLTLEAIVK